MPCQTEQPTTCDAGGLAGDVTLGSCAVYTSPVTEFHGMEAELGQLTALLKSPQDFGWGKGTKNVQTVIRMSRT
jgi:hypothetical protein